MAIIEQFVAATPVKLWLAFFVVGLLLEAFFTNGGKRDWRTALLNIRYSFVYLLAIFLLSPATNTAVNQLTKMAGAGFIDLNFFNSGSVVAQIGAAVVSLIVIDFFYYWWHRTQHSLGWLWHQHAVHHSDESLGVTTGARHHWSEFVFQALVISLPMMILFKMSAVTIWAITTVMAFYSWFIHLNLRLGFGRLSWLACSPQLHRIHHSSLEPHWDKNFAAYFPVWDVLFGTYYAPAKGEYPPTGVEGVKIDTVQEATLYPFKQWLSAARSKLRGATR